MTGKRICVPHDDYPISFEELQMAGAYKYRPQYTQNTIGPSVGGYDMEKKIVSASGAVMSEEIAHFGLQQLAHELVVHKQKPDPRLIADHWMMHPWQAMQILNQVEIEKSVAPGEPGWNFCQIRVVEDQNFPEDRIELRDKNEKVLVEFRNVGSIPHEHR